MAKKAVQEKSTEDIVADALPQVQAKKSRWAKIMDEAMSDYVPAKPYPFDFNEDNIVFISKPDTTERALALGTIIDNRGNIDVPNVRPMLEALCGEAFPYVWEVVRNLPIEVTVELVLDIQEWFFGESVDLDEVTELPGGTEDSSS